MHFLFSECLLLFFSNSNEWRCECIEVDKRKWWRWHIHRARTCLALWEKKKYIYIERLLICWTSYSAPWLQWAPTRDINGLMEFEFLRQRVWHRLCHIVVHSRTVTTTSSFAICRQHYAVEIKHTLLTPVYFAITQLACAQILWSVWNSHFNCWLRDETTFASTRHCSAF